MSPVRLGLVIRHDADVTDVTVAAVPATDPGTLAAWRALQADGAVGSPFLSWQWAEAVAAVPEVAAAVKVLRVDASGRTLGLFPVERWSGDAGVRVLGAVGRNWMGADHLDVVAVPAQRTTVADAVATFVLRDRSWDLLNLEGLVRDGALAAALERRRPRTIRRLPDRDVVCPFVDLDARDTQLLMPSRNLRKQVFRGLRVAEESGGGLALATSAGEVAAALPALMDLHQRRFNDRSEVFRTDARRRFHLEAGRRLAEHGMARVYRLRLGDEDAALLYALQLEDRVYAYTLGTSLDVGASPGRTLYGQMVLSAAAEGVAELDLLRGEHAFKLRFANGSRTDLHLRLLRPSPRSALMVAMRAAARLRRGGATAEPPAGEVED